MTAHSDIRLSVYPLALSLEPQLEKEIKGIAPKLQHAMNLFTFV